MCFKFSTMAVHAVEFRKIRYVTFIVLYFAEKALHKNIQMPIKSV